MIVRFVKKLFSVSRVSCPPQTRITPEITECKSTVPWRDKLRAEFHLKYSSNLFLQKAPPGREQELHKFVDTCTLLQNNGGSSVLVFYGPGGQGKTELCSAIMDFVNSDKEVLSKNSLCFCDVRAQNADKLNILYSIRTALRPGKLLRKPIFDVAFLRYQRLVFPGLNFRQRFSELFLEFKGLTDPGSTFGVAIDAVTSSANNIIFASVIQKYFLRLVDYYGEKKAKSLLMAYGGDVDSSAPFILNTLPALLAQDISSSAEESGILPIILFDHYESLWMGRLERDGIGGTNEDEWLRSFIQNLSRGLVIIFSRERLDHWEEVTPNEKKAVLRKSN